MQKQLTIAALAACLLLAIGCKKTDLDPNGLELKGSPQLNKLNAVATPGCDVIDFESVAPNTIISEITSAGGLLVDMTSFNSSSPSYPDAAIVFNSSAPHSEDIDLGTPSILYPGGIGNVDHGQSTAGLASNNTALGNIVVIQNFTDYGTLPYVANDDDNRDKVNESISFDFGKDVIATSITVIDVEVSEEKESGWVILYNAAGTEISRYPFPETWESGVGVINLGNTPGVRKVVLDINGSIGFDNLRFCVPTPPPPCDVIDFESAAAGTLISSITSVGGVNVAMTSSNSSNPEQPVAAMVFDSDVPHKEDLDLGTPSRLYGGKGTASHNQSDAGLASNNTALHNILIIQNFTEYGTTIPNDDDNRDATNESIVFDFSSVGTVTANAITVIDVEKSEEGESGWVILYNAAGAEITRFPFPETWESGVATINLGNTPGVRKIALDINGSIGFDNVAFCPEDTPPPPPPPTGCTRTQGYWKNHGPVTKGNQKNEWDVTSLKLGNRTYSAMELLSIFNTQPKKGNGLVSLAHQLIAAKLNIANGASYSTEVANAIAAADALIGNLVIPPVGSGFISSSTTSTLNDILTRYNEGKLGTPHCSD